MHAFVSMLFYVLLAPFALWLYGNSVLALFHGRWLMFAFHFLMLLVCVFLAVVERMYRPDP